MIGLHRVGLALLVLALVGCSGSGSSRYSIKQDHGPSGHVDLSHVPDAVPRDEPKSRGGNKSPYTVLGKKYYVMDSALGYKQRGTASWYGKKFHGHKTSNGEVYDMYGMSAAHKSLPLPTYVRVTNLANGRQVIVRVNDRGPFHGARLIDLSYAAAYKLDMLRQGTARVEIEAISNTNYRPATQALHTAPVSSVSQPAAASRYIQVGAYSSWSAAQSVKTRVELLLQGQKVDISKREGVPVLYRVRLGPLGIAANPSGLLGQLAQEGFADAQVLDLP
ncbi:septal ring lytic transglycosylase RlpA family protein [Motiliproteus sp.]|uniref:septal ring lytic transglycosylase RlpA family protein n=1 Tax=Motiliproteus sp. TaxID=1898955 RepID=UPI003BA88A29